MGVNKLVPLAGAHLDIPESLFHMGGVSDAVSLPLPVFLIEHDRGLVLVDTGIAPDAWDREAAAVYGDAVARIWPLTFPDGNDIESQFHKFGYELRDVTHVVLSHAHMDHTGGLALFPHAEFYASWVELQHAFWPQRFWMDSGAFGRSDLEKTRGFSWNLLGHDLDLFGDGSVVLLQTPGHTPGQLTTFVQLPGQAVVIVGDAAHTQQNMAGLPCPGDVDANTAHLSVQRIRQIAAAHRATVWVMHDPDQWKQFGEPGVPLR